MNNIIHKGDLPRKSVEYLGRIYEKDVYKTRFSYSPSFFDKKLKTWIASELKEEADGIYIRNSRISVKITNNNIKIYDRDKTQISEEDIDLVRQGVGFPFENNILLNSKLSTNTNTSYEELSDGWEVTKTMENDDAWMSIVYILKEGDGLKRDIYYRLKNSQGKKNLRICVRWDVPNCDTFHKPDGAKEKISKKELIKKEIPYFVFTHKDFHIGTEKKLLIKEDISSLHDDDLLANTIMGPYDDASGIWIKYWTKPQLVDSKKDNKISFNVTWTNENTSYDGSVYQEKEAGSGSSLNNIWFKKTNSTSWGSRHTLTSGYSWRRAYIRWDITQIPNNATITDVNITVYGELTVAGVDSEIRAITDPGGRTTEEIHGDIGSGALLFTNSDFPTVGSQSTWDLGSAAVSSVQTHITSDDGWAIGVKLETETGISAHEIEDNSEANPAELVVVFSVPAPTGSELAGGEWGGGEIG